MSRTELVHFYRKTRQFEPARHQHTIAAGSHDPFRVMSFNILAQGHIKRAQFPYCATETLKWPFRRERLMAEVEAYEADICALQEMDHYEKFFRGRLDHLGYSSFYAYKNPSNSPQSDGLCLAWKRSRFHLLHSHIQSFAETMKHLPEATPNIAVFVALEDMETGRRLVVANAHLYWHWDYDSLRAVQAQFLFERLLEWMHQVKLSDAEIIVCGDFNSDPTSVAYRLITRRELSTGHYMEVMKTSQLTDDQLSRLLHYFDETADPAVPLIRSSYACQEIRSDKMFGAFGEMAWTNSAQHFKDNLDYIFFKERSRLVVRRLLMLPPDEIVFAETALPNRHYVSDHVALVTEFAYVNQPYTDIL